MEEWSCPVCRLTQEMPALTEGDTALCARCDSELDKSKPDSISRTLAFSLTALILYIPANLLPILTMEYYGAVTHNTLWSGVVSLAEGDMWVVAIIVFLASIVIPLLKLMMLFLLAWQMKSKSNLKVKTKMYKFIKRIGTWSMLDIFLVAILVALVKLGNLATIIPGPGTLAFALVVVFTILATESFDPKLIWSHDNR